MQPAASARSGSSAGWRSVAIAVGLLVLFEAVANGGTLFLNAFTSLDGKTRDLLTEAALAILVLGLIAGLGWWRSTGFSTPVREWRHPWLIVLPLLLTLLPFTGGFKGVDTSMLGVLVVGYALNSLAEDGMFRGIMPRVLRDRGLITAIVLSSLLFGLAHFGNIISRPDQSVALTGAQAFGAFTEAIGVVAIRLAMRSLWPVMLVHLMADLFGQVGGAPVVVWHVAYSVAMLVYGVWIYRRYRDELAAELWASDATPAGDAADPVGAPAR
jgi:uncharacterized protein